MSKYTNVLEKLAHAHADELAVLDQGKHFIRVHEGTNPVPEFLSAVAREFNKDPKVVFNDAIKYRFSFGYQMNKKKYA